MSKTPAKTRHQELSTADEAGRALQEQAKAEHEQFEADRALEREQDEATPFAPSIQTEPPVPPDNPKNPRGKSSLSLPEQATPLTSDQGVLAEADLHDPAKINEVMVQDGLAPDNPLNPRGTPDYFVSDIVDPLEQNDQNAGK